MRALAMTTKHLQLDPASDARLLWITHALRNELRLLPSQARPTTIMRRCIDLYAVHLADLLWPPDDRYDDPRMPELARLAEAARLRECQRERRLRVPEEAVTALPVRPLSDILREHTPPPAPLLIDQLKKENERHAQQRLSRGTDIEGDDADDVGGDGPHA